jgi:hypothetical protein
MRQEAQIGGLGGRYGHKSTSIGPDGYPMTHVETWVEGGERSSSSECIVPAKLAHANPSDGFVVSGKNGMINKTVEFEFHSSKSQFAV